MASQQSPEVEVESNDTIDGCRQLVNGVSLDESESESSLLVSDSVYLPLQNGRISPLISTTPKNYSKSPNSKSPNISDLTKHDFNSLGLNSTDLNKYFKNYDSGQEQSYAIEDSLNISEELRHKFELVDNLKCSPNFTDHLNNKVNRSHNSVEDLSIFPHRHQNQINKSNNSIESDQNTAIKPKDSDLSSRIKHKSISDDRVILIDSESPNYPKKAKLSGVQSKIDGDHKNSYKQNNRSDYNKENVKHRLSKSVKEKIAARFSSKNNISKNNPTMRVHPSENTPEPENGAQSKYTEYDNRPIRSREVTDSSRELMMSQYNVSVDARDSDSMMQGFNVPPDISVQTPNELNTQSGMQGGGNRMGNNIELTNRNRNQIDAMNLNRNQRNNNTSIHSRNDSNDLALVGNRPTSQRTNQNDTNSRNITPANRHNQNSTPININNQNDQLNRHTTSQNTNQNIRPHHGSPLNDNAKNTTRLSHFRSQNTGQISQIPKTETETTPLNNANLSLIRDIANTRRTQHGGQIPVLTQGNDAPQCYTEFEAQCARRIQALWRGYRARAYNPVVIATRTELRTSRLEDHLVVLRAELQQQKSLYEEEKKMRKLQLEAIWHLWREVQTLGKWREDILNGAVTIPTHHPHTTQTEKSPSENTEDCRSSGESNSTVTGTEHLESVCADLKLQVQELSETVQRLSERNTSNNCVSSIVTCTGAASQEDGVQVKSSSPIVTDQMPSFDSMFWGSVPHSLTPYTSDEEELYFSQAPHPGCPTPPRALRVTHRDHNTVLLTWQHSQVLDDPSQLLLGYRIYLNDTPKSMLSGDKCSALVEGLDTQITYKVFVRAVSQMGESYDSDICITAFSQSSKTLPYGHTHDHTDESDNQDAILKTRSRRRKENGKQRKHKNIDDEDDSSDVLENTGIYTRAKTPTRGKVAKDGHDGRKNKYESEIYYTQDDITSYTDQQLRSGECSDGYGQNSSQSGKVKMDDLGYTQECGKGLHVTFGEDRMRYDNQGVVLGVDFGVNRENSHERDDMRSCGVVVGGVDCQSEKTVRSAIIDNDAVFCGTIKGVLRSPQSDISSVDPREITHDGQESLTSPVSDTSISSENRGACGGGGDIPKRPVNVRRSASAGKVDNLRAKQEKSDEKATASTDVKNLSLMFDKLADMSQRKLPRKDRSPSDRKNPLRKHWSVENIRGLADECEKGDDNESESKHDRKNDVTNEKTTRNKTRESRPSSEIAKPMKDVLTVKPIIDGRHRHGSSSRSNSPMALMEDVSKSKRIPVANFLDATISSVVGIGLGPPTNADSLTEDEIQKLAEQEENSNIPPANIPTGLNIPTDQQVDVILNLTQSQESTQPCDPINQSDKGIIVEGKPPTPDGRPHISPTDRPKRVSSDSEIHGTCLKFTDKEKSNSSFVSKLLQKLQTFSKTQEQSLQASKKAVKVRSKSSRVVGVHEEPRVRRTSEGETTEEGGDEEEEYNVQSDSATCRSGKRRALRRSTSYTNSVVIRDTTRDPTHSPIIKDGRKVSSTTSSVARRHGSFTGILPSKNHDRKQTEGSDKRGTTDSSASDSGGHAHRRILPTPAPQESSGEPTLRARSRSPSPNTLLHAVSSASQLHHLNTPP